MKTRSYFVFSILCSCLLISIATLPLAFADSMSQEISEQTTVVAQSSSAKEEITSEPISAEPKEEITAQPVSTEAQEEISSQESQEPSEPPKVIESVVEPPPAEAPKTTPTESISQEKEKEFTGPRITVGGGGFFLNRNDFLLLQPQNERHNLNTQRIGKPFDYRMSDVGSFGNVEIEQPFGKDFAVAASFLGSNMERSQNKKVPGGTNTGEGTFIENATVLPLLLRRGGSDQLQNGSVVEIGGKPYDANARANTDFDYSTQQYDVAVDMVREKLCLTKDFRLDGLIGFGYTHINQDMNLHTTGINNNTIALVETNTAESLQDNLFGGRVGVRTHLKVNPKISLKCNIIGGFYSDSIRYDGTQEVQNASFVGWAPWSSFTIRSVQTTDRFVPRIDTRTSLSFEITPQVSAEISYLFNSFWNVSNVDHPKAIDKHQPTAGPLGFPVDDIDHEVQIGSETLTQHFIELKLAFKF